MLEKIYASTLYKASKNKDAIKSALEDPVNLELVQQLREYLDDDVREELAEPKFDNFDSFDEDFSDVDFDKTEGDEGGASESRSSSRPSPHLSSSPASFTSKEDHFDDLKDFEEGMDNAGEGGNTTSEEPADEPAEDAAAVESSVTIQTKLDLDALQGTLNSREDTAGVSYILQNDNELWIHYNDKVNLNNVMENVITLLRNLNYDNLTFNRLARSANAVVFEIVMTNINNYSMSKEDEK